MSPGIGAALSSGGASAAGGVMAEFIKDAYGWAGIRLSSGREIGLNHGLLSVNPDFEMGDGYDSAFSFKRLHPNFPSGPEDYVPNFTAEEVSEIADLQLALWAAVKVRGSWEDWG